jgi:hypothetical protein
MTAQTAAKLHGRHHAVFNPAGIGLAVIVGLLALVAPSAATAGTWIQVSCPGTSQTEAASPGWTTLSSFAFGKYDGASTECGGGMRMQADLAALEPAQGGRL